MLILSHRNNEYIPKKGHTTYKNSQGLYVPSVTTVIKMIPKESLIYWANHLGWQRKSVTKELNYSAEVGTHAHNIIEKIILGTYGEDDKQYLNDTLVHNSVTSFYLWWKENKNDIEIVDIERKLEGEEYGGTCDCICRYKGKLMIFDFKTSKDFYFSMFVQLAAYVKLYENVSNEKVQDVAVLRMDKNKGNIAEIKFMSDINNGCIDFYYDVFKKCLDLYRSIYMIENDWGISHV